MDVNKLMLNRIIDSTERLDAPLFHRPYVWSRDRNWAPLWGSHDAVRKPPHADYKADIGDLEQQVDEGVSVLYGAAQASDTAEGNRT